MSAIRLFFLVVFGAASVSLTKVPCELTDEACITAAADILIKKVVAGIPDIGLESSDPIHVNSIEADLSTIKYSLSNANFHGMQDCRVEHLNIDLKAMTSLLNLVCPRLTLDSNYFIKGSIESLDIEGKGKCKVVHDDYHIGLLFSVETTAAASGEVYLHVKSFELNPLEVRGGVNYKFENLYDGDKEKSDAAHDFLNKNWQKVSPATQGPAMKSFMDKFVKNINIYLGKTPMTEIFYAP